jgi:hypothetical protein
MERLSSSIPDRDALCPMHVTLAKVRTMQDSFPPSSSPFKLANSTFFPSTSTSFRTVEHAEPSSLLLAHDLSIDMPETEAVAKRYKRTKRPPGAEREKSRSLSFNGNHQPTADRSLNVYGL